MPSGKRPGILDVHGRVYLHWRLEVEWLLAGGQFNPLMVRLWPPAVPCVFRNPSFGWAASEWAIRTRCRLLRICASRRPKKWKRSALPVSCLRIERVSCQRRIVYECLSSAFDGLLVWSDSSPRGFFRVSCTQICAGHNSCVVDLQLTQFTARRNMSWANFWPAGSVDKWKRHPPITSCLHCCAALLDAAYV